MTDKEKYISLVQRYWEAETTPEEERALAWYAARVDDPEFDELRGVLGYLSVGRQERARRSRTTRFYSYAVAACIALVAALGLGLSMIGRQAPQEHCVSYAYGEKVEDNAVIMSWVEDSLIEMFQR